MEFNIQNIIEQMQEFQKEFHNEFKDWKTFWKHYYRKLDEVINKELLKLLEDSDEEIETEKNPQEEVLDFIKTIAKKIWIDEIEIIEVNKK